jgi:hypothetical protein
MVEGASVAGADGRRPTGTNVSTMTCRAASTRSPTTASPTGSATPPGATGGRPAGIPAALVTHAAYDAEEMTYSLLGNDDRWRQKQLAGSGSADR